MKKSSNQMDVNQSSPALRVYCYFLLCTLTMTQFLFQIVFLVKLLFAGTRATDLSNAIHAR